MSENLWSIIIAALSLVFSIVSLTVSLHIDSKRHKTHMYTEYTKRFQDILLQIYSDSDHKKAYHRLYFNLCSEEYYLYRKKELPDDIWKKWVYGMKLMMKDSSFCASWKVESLNFDMQKDFINFFNDIIRQSENNQY